MNYSRQRQSILDIVKSTKTHPTVEWIYEKARIENPNISLGTVYRNLDKMVSANEILKLSLPNEADRFDGDISTHYHGKCVSCGNIVDIFTDYYSKLDEFVEKDTGMKILSHRMFFNTICPECEKNEEELKWN